MNFRSIKKSIIMSLFIMSLLIISACSSDDSDNAETDTDYTIRISFTQSEDHPEGLASTQFKESVEEKSEGKIKVDLYPNGQLYDSEREALEAVKANNVELAVGATAVMANFQPEFSVISLPFLFNTTEEADEALDGELGEKLTSLLSDQNFVSLGFGENGFRHFLNNEKPFEVPEDFKGMKLRVIENKMFEDMFKELGASPTPLGFGEVYSALQQGTFDGVNSEITVATDSKFYEVVDYFTLAGFSYTPIITVINKEFFEELPSDLQEIVMEEGEKAFSTDHRKANRKLEEENLEVLKEEMEVNELTSEQKDVFRERLQPVYDKYAEELGEDIMEFVK